MAKKIYRVSFRHYVTNDESKVNYSETNGSRDTDYTSRAKAVAAFHTLAGKAIHDGRAYVCLAFVFDPEQNGSIVMATKSRKEYHVELSQTFYEETHKTLS